MSERIRDYLSHRTKENFKSIYVKVELVVVPLDNDFGTLEEVRIENFFLTSLPMHEIEDFYKELLFSISVPVVHRQG